jgi:hypothetical protein
MDTSKKPEDKLDLEIKKYERYDKTGIVLLPLIILTIFIVALVPEPIWKIFAIIVCFSVFIIYAAIDTHWKMLKLIRQGGAEFWEKDRDNRKMRIRFGTMTMVSASVVGISGAFLIIFIVAGISDLKMFGFIVMLFIIGLVVTIWSNLKYDQTRKKKPTH